MFCVLKVSSWHFSIFMHISDQMLNDFHFELKWIYFHQKNLKIIN